MEIAPLQQQDYTDWLPLWRANMEHSVTDDVTVETWRRICDPASPVKGLRARNAEGALIGICHYVLHPTTGNIKMIAYMQDLYVHPDHRRKGIARKLVTYLAALGTAQGWARIYWLAEGKNEAAQRLYETLGLKLDFTLHVLPL
jgi:ribosomal protein S18 acetylase RimI-like enzyme